MTCRRCHRTQWVDAIGNNQARRLLRDWGWLVGADAQHDICPGCRSQREPSSRTLTPAQKRAAFLRMGGYRQREPAASRRQLLGGSLLDFNAASAAEADAAKALSDPHLLAQALSALGEVTVAARKAANTEEPSMSLNHGPAVSPAPPASAVEGLRQVFTQRDNAKRGAKRLLEAIGVEAKMGRNYRVDRVGSEAFVFTLIADAFTPEALAKARAEHKRRSRPGRSGRSRTASTEGASFAKRSSAIAAAERELIRAGVERPTIGLDYDVEQHPNTTSTWRRLDRSAPIGQAQPKAPEPAPSPTQPELPLARKRRPFQRGAHLLRYTPDAGLKANRGIHARGFNSPSAARRAAETYLIRWGVAPVEGQTHRVYLLDDGYAWEPVDSPALPAGLRAAIAEEQGVPASPGAAEGQRVAVSPEPPPVQPADLAPAPMAPLGARQAIAFTLEHDYDREAQRYRGSGSDRTVAEKVGAQPVDVAFVRELLFGQYDRNETDAAAKADALDAKINAVLDELVKLQDEARALREGR